VSNNNQPLEVTMQNGSCPKCRSTKVHAGTDISFKRGAYGSNTIPITAWSVVALVNYVCVQCGYVESYVADPAKRQEIADKWPRVGLDY
jgi:predicted nucleic-acid-binding Zn-ribbon protein